MGYFSIHTAKAGSSPLPSNLYLPQVIPQVDPAKAAIFRRIELTQSIPWLRAQRGRIAAEFTAITAVEYAAGEEDETEAAGDQDLDGAVESNAMNANADADDDEFDEALDDDDDDDTSAEIVVDYAEDGAVDK